MVRAAGERIPTRARRLLPPILSEFAGDFRIVFTGSGTEALALGLSLLRGLRDPIERSEAIVPAYCCPDVVAACAASGYAAVAVDVEEDRPHFDTGALGSAVDECTTAVIAPASFGVPCNLDRIQHEVGRSVTVIEDCAQMPPCADYYIPRGDLVVYSFGRGKPCSVLSGGALMIRRSWEQRRPLALPTSRLTRRPTPLTLLRRQILRMTYNALLHPRPYALLTAARVGGIGISRYIPLRTRPALHLIERRLARQYIVEHYTAAAFLRVSAIAALLQECAAITEVVGAGIVSSQAYSVGAGRLAAIAQSRSKRDAIVRRLIGAGVQATCMYGRPLTQFGAPVVSRKECTNATKLADRILTVPCNSAVTDPVLRAIADALRQVDSD